jgi:hypothetical protein
MKLHSYDIWQIYGLGGGVLGIRQPILQKLFVKKLNSVA